jgi:histidine triad (HIT) family protein
MLINTLKSTRDKYISSHNTNARMIESVYPPKLQRALENQVIIHYTIKYNSSNKLLPSMDCIFCKIVKGESPAHKIWEDEKHLAFLSIFPNTEGFSVVITKEHYPSYAFDLPEDVFVGLAKAAEQTAKLLDAKLEDVGRTGMIFEGFGVDHVHAKLFPMHGTKMSEWKPLKSNVDKYFEKYEGYISSHDYKRADDEKLSELAKKIRK